MKLLSIFIFTVVLFSQSFQQTEEFYTEAVDCETSVPVALDYGTFVGARCEEFYERFTGIPFAEPPVGNLRLRNPVPPRRYYSLFDATRRAPACTQQSPTAGSGFWQTLFTPAMAALRSGPMFAPLVEGQEDCLTIDIIRPVMNDINQTDLLPVMMFIYGGAFVFGSTSTYPGQSLVMKSISLNQPVIYVAANYRLGAFGFLGGKEVGAAKIGNLGLKDQRLALEWVQKHIGQFGGDPDKVMLFGQSAGAMSVAYHLMGYGGQLNGLFRAAICESGSALPTSRLSEGGGQDTYNLITEKVGCMGNHRLECLRSVDFRTLVDAQNEIAGFLTPDFYPPPFAVHIDGEFLTDTPSNLMKQGKFAKVPIITGNQDDEGTALGFGQISTVTETRFKRLIRKIFSNATEDQLDTLFTLYPQDITQGSPFHTGRRNAITPVYKRYSALLGDFVFHSLRRKFLKVAHSQVPSWSYIDVGHKNTPILGSFHTSELLAVFGVSRGLFDRARSHEFQTRWIAFANTLTPNKRGLKHWSTYGKNGRMMKFGDTGAIRMVSDDFRSSAIDFLSQNEGMLII